MFFAYDPAFNGDGEMFPYDADIAWDVGLPWYRPTRVLHLVSGADYGWRHGDSARRQAPHQPATLAGIRERYEGLEPPWRRPEGPKFPRGG